MGPVDDEGVVSILAATYALRIAGSGFLISHMAN